MIVENISHFSVGVCYGAIRMLEAIDTMEFTYFQNTFWLVLMSEAILSSYDL